MTQVNIRIWKAKFEKSNNYFANMNPYVKFKYNGNK